MSLPVPRLLSALLPALALLGGAPALALDPGDLVVSQSNELLRVDPTTGNRSVLSGGAVGSGPALLRVTRVGFDRDGFVLVADFDLKAVLRVDPATGDRSIVASQSVGSGLPFRPLGVDRPALYPYLAVESDGPSVVFVDPASGDRTVVSSGAVGSGPLFGAPDAIRVRGQGTTAFVTDFSLHSVLKVDWTTGTRTLHSGPGVGAGPLLDLPRGLGLAVGGDLFVADDGLDAIVRIDGSTGDRSVVSDAVTGSGPTFDSPHDVRSEAGGSLVVPDFGLGAVFRVDPSTGDRTIVSDAVTGSGPALASPRAIAVVPTPRSVTGFEADPPGLPPAGLPVGGNVFVEPVSDAPEGSQVLTLTTGPGANGLGPMPIDATGDGNLEDDRAQALFDVERGPTDPPALTVELAVLTGESPVPGVGHADPVTIGLDAGIGTAPLLTLSVHFDNGTYTALTGFTGGPRAGLDGSSYDEGQVGYLTLQLPVDVGPHAFYFEVADELDDLGDSAWRIDDLRFAPEPGGWLPLAAGVAALLGLARGRARARPARRSASSRRRIRGILRACASRSATSSSTSTRPACGGRAGRWPFRDGPSRS